MAHIVSRAVGGLYRRLGRAAFRFGYLPVDWVSALGFRVAEHLSDPES